MPASARFSTFSRLACLLALSTIAAEARAVTYTVTDLGPIGDLNTGMTHGPTIHMSGANAAGQYGNVGNRRTYYRAGSGALQDLGVSRAAPLGIDGTTVVGTGVGASGADQAFVYQNGVATPLPMPVGATKSYANAVSGSNVTGVVGYPDGSFAPVIWVNGGAPQVIGGLPVNAVLQPRAIDGANVAGETTVAGVIRAYVSLDGGAATAITPLSGGANAWVSAISGTNVVGEGVVSSGDTHAYLSVSGGAALDLGTLGGAFSNAKDVSGTNVTGEASLGNGSNHAYLSRETATGRVMFDLGTLGGTISVGNAIHGTNVVGQAELANGSRHAFVSLDGGAMVDLNPLGWASSTAVWIGANGDVSGWGVDGNGAYRTFYATQSGGTTPPVVPEPGSAVLALAGIGTWMHARRYGRST